MGTFGSKITQAKHLRTLNVLERGYVWHESLQKDGAGKRVAVIIYAEDGSAIIYNLLTTYHPTIISTLFTQELSHRVERVREEDKNLLSLGVLAPNYLLNGQENLKGKIPDLTIVLGRSLQNIEAFDAIIILAEKNIMPRSLLEEVKHAAKPTAVLTLVTIDEAQSAKVDSKGLLSHFTKIKWKGATRKLSPLRPLESSGRKRYKKLLKSLLIDLELEGAPVRKAPKLKDSQLSKAIYDELHSKVTRSADSTSMGNALPEKALKSFSLWVAHQYPETDPEVLVALWQDGSISGLYSLIDTLESIQGL